MELNNETFEAKLKTLWNSLYNNAKKNAIFLSKIDNVEMRKLDKGYVAYHNLDLFAKKPPTQIKEEREFVDSKEPATVEESEKKASITLPFDDSKFHFLKSPPLQSLLYYDEENDRFIYQENEPYYNIADVPPKAYGFLINAYPVARYHTLIIPYPSMKLPQVFEENIFSKVLHLYALVNPNEFYLGFNGALGGASVNHLHYHIFNTHEIAPSGELAIEGATTKPIHKIDFTTLEGATEILLEETIDYPAKAFVIRAPALGKIKEKGALLNQIAKIVGKIISLLMRDQIPHNIVVVKGGMTTYVFPRKYEIFKKEFNISPAWIEIVGIAVCRQKEAFSTLTAEVFEELINDEVCVSETFFADIKDSVLSIL